MVRESGRDDRADRAPQGGEDGGDRQPVRTGETRQAGRGDPATPTREAAGPVDAAEDAAVPDQAATDRTAADAAPAQGTLGAAQTPSPATPLPGDATDVEIDGNAMAGDTVAAAAIPGEDGAAVTPDGAVAGAGGDTPAVLQDGVATAPDAAAVGPVAATDNGQQGATPAVPATPAEPAAGTSTTNTPATPAVPAAPPARAAAPGATPAADAMPGAETADAQGDAAAESGTEFDGENSGRNGNSGDSDGEPAAQPQGRAPGEAALRPGAAEPARRGTAGASTPAQPADPIAKPAAPVEQAASPTSGAQPQAGHAAPAASFGSELRTALAATTGAAQTAAPQGVPTPAAEQLAVRIHRAVHEGADRLTLQLKPFELGRVSVQIELTHDHRVIAVISAERAETMDLLQRDARALERALQDAGLKTDSNSLSFEAHGDGDGRRFGDREGSGRLFAMPVANDEIGTDALPAQAWQPGDGRMDIRI
jgi:flagellar hook-length control protein FliK